MLCPHSTSLRLSVFETAIFLIRPIYWTHPSLFYKQLIFRKKYARQLKIENIYVSI
nr:MAG TPA: hypothetical protein [Caudoviricetes sp.]